MVNKKRITLALIAFIVLALAAYLVFGRAGNVKSVYDRRNQKASANYDILTSNEWEYDFGGCAYELEMSKDGRFINYCACGSSIDYSDLIEYFIYDDDKKVIYLYDYNKEYIDTGKVIETSEDSVTIDLYDEVCEYVSVGKTTED